jgi:hypothetical protein
MLLYIIFPTNCNCMRVGTECNSAVDILQWFAYKSALNAIHEIFF